MSITLKKTTMPSQDDKNKLIETVSQLKESDPFYKRRLKMAEIHEATGIPIGTIGYQLKYRKLSDTNYKKLLTYIQALQIAYNEINESKTLITEI